MLYPLVAALANHTPAFQAFYHGGLLMPRAGLLIPRMLSTSLLPSRSDKTLLTENRSLVNARLMPQPQHGPHTAQKAQAAGVVHVP